jgi:hypothetical protein
MPPQMLSAGNIPLRWSGNREFKVRSINIWLLRSQVLRLRSPKTDEKQNPKASNSTHTNAVVAVHGRSIRQNHLITLAQSVDDFDCADRIAAQRD